MYFPSRITLQYAVSKLYNDPLLRTSISLVASQDGQNRDSSSENVNMESGDKATENVANGSELLQRQNYAIEQFK